MSECYPNRFATRSGSSLHFTVIFITLFTFSAFLGAVTMSGPSGALGASIALIAVFLPSALLVIGVLPCWERLRRAPRVQRA